MRKSMILVASLLGATTLAFADAARELQVSEIRDAVKTVDAQIGQCYLGAVGDRAGAGRLDITLAIHRKGLVDHVDVKAPNLPAKVVAKIDLCVRETVAKLEFPARKVGVTATIPYFWQKTAAANAGPYESCWDAKGCKTNGDVTKPEAVAQPPAKKKPTAQTQARRAPRG
jgi:hypothetical protein